MEHIAIFVVKFIVIQTIQAYGFISRLFRHFSPRIFPSLIISFLKLISIKFFFICWWSLNFYLFFQLCKSNYDWMINNKTCVLIGQVLMTWTCVSWAWKRQVSRRRRGQKSLGVISRWSGPRVTGRRTLNNTPTRCRLSSCRNAWQWQNDEGGPRLQYYRRELKMLDLTKIVIVLWKNSLLQLYLTYESIVFCLWLLGNSSKKQNCSELRCLLFVHLSLSFTIFISEELENDHKTLLSDYLFKKNRFGLKTVLNNTVI